MTTSKINFWVFSFMFALSFALLYGLKDYNIYSGRGADVAAYITTFQTINDIAWSEIFYRFITLPNGNEPLYWLYIKITYILFFGNAVFFTFFHYFLTFVLIAYLGKIVDKNKFMIIIVCILLLDYNVLIGIPLFRQTTAFLIFFIGLFSFDANERKWFPRFLIYSSFFFHISLAPIIIFFEFFSLVTKGSLKFEFSKLYSKEMVVYITIVVLIFIFANKDLAIIFARPFGLADNLAKYYLVSLPPIPYSGVLFNWFTYMILLSLWLKRKKISNMHVFVATQYFIFIFLLNELNVPDVFGRYQYYLRLGGAIIIGYLGTTNYRIIFPLLMFIFIRFYYKFHFLAQNHLKDHIYSGYLDPVSGLGNMILNFDTILSFNF